MKWLHLIHLAMLIGLTASVGGQVAVPSSESRTEVPQDLKPGVVIEEIAKYSEGEKAGLKEGDIILHWACGGASGEIQLPSDLNSVEIEQAPRGVVTVEGFRG